MNRTSEARAGIVHEAEMLRFIERERSALAGVPRSRGLVGRGALVLLAESPVVGRSLDAELSAATFSQHANDVTDWLLALAGRTPPVTREAWWSRLIEPVLSTFRAEFGSVLDEGDLEGGLAALKDLPDLPLVPEQRDMGPWNLVLGRDGIGVLDWESAEPSGLPVLDLIYFLVYAAFHVAGARRSDNLLDTYRAVRTPTTLLGRVARDCLVRYCRGLEVPPGVLHQLHLLTWMIHAQSEHRRLVEDAGGPPTQRALRSALLPALWQAEMSLRDLT
jgi:hypothetical protein